ncbi:hypothetical protein BCR34DRAFT_587235 [Clohesyomyces aquaticus]|uniref:Uncharacterized protein n=1 Tax=Clohesyomyces aquaticus TaxID=1231657 RepID=A0A1Y1ZRN0_9PLEO|nr:hypothetical protein BCR34DRAFT_587235 [Clohesyomyces aquaticus]
MTASLVVTAAVLTAMTPFFYARTAASAYSALMGNYARRTPTLGLMMWLRSSLRAGLGLRNERLRKSFCCHLTACERYLGEGVKAYLCTHYRSAGTTSSRATTFTLTLSATSRGN